MKVHKSTWLNIKSGCPEDIMEAISDSLVPTRAIATDIRWDYAIFNVDALLDASDVLPPSKQMRFEWTDEE